MKISLMTIKDIQYIINYTLFENDTNKTFYIYSFNFKNLVVKDNSGKQYVYDGELAINKFLENIYIIKL